MKQSDAREQPRSDAKNERESLVHGAQLARIEASRRSAEASRIYYRRLLDENAGITLAERDRRAEARRPSAR